MIFSRQEILRRLHAQVVAGKPIVDYCVGSGISAKMAEVSGADIVIVSNSGRYRMAGRNSIAGLMAYGDANEIVTEMAKEVLSVVKKTPVIAGVNGTDPFRLFPMFLKQLKEMGFSGVQNFPTVGLIDGNFRVNLECTDMGYDKEIEVMAIAHELDLFTAPYVFDVDQAKAMAKVGADQLVVHMGLAAAGSAGATGTLALDEAVARATEIAEAGCSVRENILVVVHGGPFDKPENMGKALLCMPGIHGFLGPSSIEGLPIERVICSQVNAFKSLKMA